MNDSDSICLSCGYCCDGTLIGFVQLDPEELSRVRSLLDLEEVDGGGFFIQPCRNYCDGCGIYSDRPKQCASFKCQLLKSVEQESLEFNEAVDIIHEVKQKKAVIEDQLEALQLDLKSNSFYFKIVELRQAWRNNKSETSPSIDLLSLMSDIEALDDLLSKRFGMTLS